MSGRNFVPALPKGGHGTRIAILAFNAILLCIASFLVVSCGVDGPGAIWVDPGKFTFYHCDDLARRWKDLTARESDLRSLIEKANESSAGAVIGSIAYRSDYEAVLSEKKLLQRTSAEKKCSFPTDYQSDESIR
jgi:hypothetical protein